MTVLRASKKTLSWAATWRPSSLPPRSMMSVSTISSVRATNRMAATGLLRGHISRASTLARSGRSSDPEQMDNFRQEVHGNGLSSYPHPKLMPEFWQFPTVSMGLGPIGAIYRAKFLKYLEHRGLKDTSKQTVYAFLGDGEMDEPESKARSPSPPVKNWTTRSLLSTVTCSVLTARSPVTARLLTNWKASLQVLAGTLLKSWGGRWDELLRKDTSGKLIQLMNETVDGDYQTFKSKDGAYVREHFFGKYPKPPRWWPTGPMSRFGR